MWSVEHLIAFGIWIRGELDLGSQVKVTLMPKDSLPAMKVSRPNPAYAGTGMPVVPMLVDTVQFVAAGRSGVYDRVWYGYSEMFNELFIVVDS